jgi:hypothetical protein
MCEDMQGILPKTPRAENARNPLLCKTKTLMGFYRVNQFFQELIVFFQQNPQFLIGAYALFAISRKIDQHQRHHDEKEHEKAD